MDTFTTKPDIFVRRGNKTVRARCIAFIETLNFNHVKEIPVDEAKALFSLIIDEWDRSTLKAYFGTQTGFTKRKFERLARYQSGTTSMKTLELKQFIPHKKGYLERLGLVTVEKRGETWFLIVRNPQIVPEFGNANSRFFNDDLSLSSNTRPIHDNAVVHPIATSVQLDAHVDNVGERRERVHRTREINRSGESEQQPELTAEDKAFSEA